MKLKIKSQPEDFIVDEVVSLPIKERGPFAVYKMWKRSWNTVDAVQEVARGLNLPYDKISYGGKKDRHAVTTQYITIEGRKAEGFKKENISLEFIGFSDRAMGPDLIEANSFQITVRDLKPDQIKTAVRNLKNIQTSGYPNYFDDQRFGSWDPLNGFIAAKILKDHYNGAVKIYLTAIHPEEKSGDKARKKFFAEHWRQWDVCLKEAKTAVERKAFSDLNKKEPKALENILKAIPREDLSMAFSAYQSHLWNEMVRRLLLKKADPGSLRRFQGVVGDYLFFDRLDKMPYDYLKKLKIQTAAHNTRMPDKLTDLMYQKLLKEEEITPSMFNKIKMRQAFFKAYERAVLLKPKDLSWDEGADHLILRFTLPKGSYGTILIKSLFASKETAHDQKVDKP